MARISGAGPLYNVNSHSVILAGMNESNISQLYKNKTPLQLNPQCGNCVGQSDKRNILHPEKKKMLLRTS